MKKKILVVDDNPSILEAVELILSSEGYDVKTLLQGDQTYETVVSYNPNIIILDLLLSGKNGQEITVELKASQKTRDIPVVIISAHPEAQKSAEKAGAEGFLEKPFDVADLLSTITSFLKKAS